MITRCSLISSKKKSKWINKCELSSQKRDPWSTKRRTFYKMTARNNLSKIWNSIRTSWMKTWDVLAMSYFLEKKLTWARFIHTLAAKCISNSSGSWSNFAVGLSCLTTLIVDFKSRDQPQSVHGLRSGPAIINALVRLLHRIKAFNRSVLVP